MLGYALNENYSGDLAGYVTEDGTTANALIERLYRESELRKQYGVELTKYSDSLYSSGCMLFSLMYGIENINNSKYDIELLNKWMVEKNLYTGKDNNDLGTEYMAKAWNLMGGGFYQIDYTRDYTVTIPNLISLNYSQDQYIGHIRIKDPANSGAIAHSVMINRIDYEYDKYGIITGVKGVYVANPLRGEYSYNSQSYYTLDAINRMDIFKVTPTSLFYKYQSYINSQGAYIPDYYRKK